MKTRWLIVVYGLASLFLLWPVPTAPHVLVSGSPRGDLWNSLWSLWFFQRSVWSGALPVHTGLLGFPHGGTVGVVDPLDGLLLSPLIPTVGLVPAYNLLVFGHLVFAGVAAHRLAERVVARPGAGWIAGPGWMGAPILISAIHNGASESLGGGWLPLALWALLGAIRKGGAARVGGAGLLLALCALASWYAGVCVFLAAGFLLVLGEGRGAPGSPPHEEPDGSPSGLLARRLRRGLPAVVLGAGLAAPAAWALHRATTGKDNLVGIKGPRELALVRRTTGAADFRTFFVPGDFRSPDFRELSRYGEDFMHCPYLGWILLASALALALLPRRRRGTGWLAAAGVTGGVLALGPVAVRDGMALILPGERAIPLPYLLLEPLPGFASLSLVYRLARLPALAVAVLASATWAGHSARPRILALAVGGVIFLEHRLAAPTAGLPDVARAEGSPALEQLARAPEGAVMNFPVVGGRRYLFEQTLHEKPLAATLNFPNNRTARRAWRALEKAIPLAGTEASGSPTAPDYARAVQEGVCPTGIRYLVVHDDPDARPDVHDRSVAALERTLTPAFSDPRTRIYDLCTPAAPEEP